MKAVVLRVAVPKASERGPMAAEQLLSALHAIGDSHGLWDRLSGRPQPRLGLEIVGTRGTVRFLIWTPADLRITVEGQLYARYPQAQIKEVPDHSQQVPVGERKGSSGPMVMTAEITLAEPDVYPLRRHFQFAERGSEVSSDPLDGLTTALGSLGSNGGQAWIQIALRPAPTAWGRRALACLKFMHRPPLDRSPWLRRLGARLLLARGAWTRLLLMPVRLVLWMMTGGGSLPLRSTGGRDLDETVSEAGDREDAASAAINKIGRPVFEVSLRLAYVAREGSRRQAERELRKLTGSLGVFGAPHLNRLVVSRMGRLNRVALRRYQQRLVERPFILSAQELATLYHLPMAEASTAGLKRSGHRRLEPPRSLPDPGREDGLAVLGRTDFRGEGRLVGLRQEDRLRHLYIIGKTGMGKSALLQNLIAADIRAGRGVALLDPHGDLAEAVLGHVPSQRTNDVAYLDPADTAYPFALNMLEHAKDPHRRSLMASGVVGVFKKQYADSWGPRLEYILRNCLLALGEHPRASIPDVLRLLADSRYRREVVGKVSDSQVRRFWTDEFARMPQRLRAEAIAPIQNKVGQCLSSSLMRGLLGQARSTVDPRFMMDTGKIVIVNLSKGRIGEDNSALLGAMLVTRFQLDAMSRAELPEEKRRDFHLYADEFQNFATDAFTVILSEARKYRLGLTMAHQYVAQMPQGVREAVFGNVGSVVAFQSGFDDAQVLASQFAQEVEPTDLVSLPRYRCYARVLVGSAPSGAFSLATLPPPVPAGPSARRETIRRLSRERYGRPQSN